MTTEDSDRGQPAFQTEIDHGHDEYTDDELLEQSQLNAQAYILSVFDTMMDDSVQLDRLTNGIARTFARAWDTDRAWEPVEILDALLTNFRSLGGEVDAYKPEQVPPSAVVVELPSADLLEQLGVPATSFRPMLVVSERLVELLGSELEWNHDAAEGCIRLQVNSRS